MAELTPMKKQYNEIKAQHKDCLLFFRLGDFYEMFDDDAKLASKELDLALTTRDRGKPQEEQTPMCGVPYHSCEAYIGRLIAKGYKVAICEQTEDPAEAKGLVSRDVIRIITPGTVTETSMLKADRSNYLTAVYYEEGQGGAAFCDISTGEFCVSSFESEALAHLQNELGRFSPKEAIITVMAENSPEITGFLKNRLDCMVKCDNTYFDYDAGVRLVTENFGKPRSDLGLDHDPAAVRAAGALLAYIIETQKCDLSHINELDVFTRGRYMEMDYATRRSLELTESQRTGDKKGSLLWVLDKTKTPMGTRLLRSWIERPLLSPVAIKRRLTAVQELTEDTVTRRELMETLRQIGDFRRVAGKCVYGTANGKDLLAIGQFCSALPRLQALLAPCRSAALREIAGLDPLEDLCRALLRAICDEPPFSVREGGILRDGYSEEVDRLRALTQNGTSLIRELEQRERDRTGIKKLKVGYNKVFGYYIDVPKSVGDAPIPDDYIRKQTLVSNERYFTEELKQLENDLLTARDQLCDLEYRYFCELRDALAAQIERIQATADLVAALDVFCSLAEVAVRRGYTMPEIDTSSVLDIREGRHPVVEAAREDTLFVPNDTYLNGSTDLVAIVTGPNMAGKSTYMRQTALIVLMAQIGSFVPAKSATIGVVDRVFTRIGASDDLAAGQSTFMVEMAEVASILQHATDRSLLILDEIGRGTSTFDGMAIAQAVLEHCADRKKLGAKTMFATHYHELSRLEGVIPGVRNYNISAKKQGDQLLFLRKIIPGAADDSYGIEVAKLAGVPASVVSRAKAHLRDLESRNTDAPAPAVQAAPAADSGQLGLGDLAGQEVLEQLRGLSPDTLTPIEALTLLYELKKKADAT